MNNKDYIYYQGQKANDTPENADPVKAMHEMMDKHQTFLVNEATGILRPNDLLVVRAIIMRQSLRMHAKVSATWDE
jgi:hypothetical protein